MNDDSRAVRTPLARALPQVVRLLAGDAEELHAYLACQDVRPCPSVADLVAFLGRKDAATFALRKPQIAAVASAALENASAHLQWIFFEARDARLAGGLIRELASFGRTANAALLYARVAQGSGAQALLRRHGFEEDAREREIIAGRPRTVVGLVKVMSAL